jgi:hypothetical protein
VRVGDQAENLSAADYRIERIATGLAQEVIVAEHYLHRKAPCEHAYGLYSPDSKLCGVVMYGTPSSAPLRSGIAGPEHALNVIELTRLWVHDDVPRNGESFLIGNTVRLNTKEIVVSFADTSQGHSGTVYQATNWLYTGLSAKRTDWVVEGIDKHGQTWGDKHTAAEMRALYGDRFRLQPRPRKHRYVYLNGSRTRRRHLFADLRYAIQPYPEPTRTARDRAA